MDQSGFQFRGKFKLIAKNMPTSFIDTFKIQPFIYENKKKSIIINVNFNSY